MSSGGGLVKIAGIDKERIRDFLDIEVDDGALREFRARRNGALLGVDIAGACDLPAGHFDIRMTKSVSVSSAPAPNATIPRTSDLALAWTPGSGTLLVELGGIECTFDAAAGSATIPKSLLAEMQPGAATLDLQLYDELLTTVGDRRYRITTGSDVLGPDGSLFQSRAVTIQ